MDCADIFVVETLYKPATVTMAPKLLTSKRESDLLCSDEIAVKCEPNALSVELWKNREKRQV
jgi:hypothetical protein